MDLWIRSQDKRLLIKCNSVGVDYKSIQVNFEDGVGFVIAEYQTKERALEVLYEIQKIMQAKYALNFDEKKESFKIFSPTQCQKIIENMAVYEMPKE